MSETATIIETCACGATFRVTAWPPAAQNAAKAWRTQHKCSQPIPSGPCWHDSGMGLPGLPTWRCELKAGHLGAHECERHNGTAVWPADLPTAPAEDETTHPTTAHLDDGRGNERTTEDA